MKAIADTNVLVRAVMNDDAAHSPIAQRLLTTADVVALPLVALCEFAWVLTRTYRKSGPDIAHAIRALVDSRNARVDRAAVAAGLAMLDAGGDFADGVIAFEGQSLGGTIFTSFDRAAVNRLKDRDAAALDVGLSA